MIVSSAKYAVCWDGFNNRNGEGYFEDFEECWLVRVSSSNMGWTFAYGGMGSRYRMSSIFFSDSASSRS